MSKDCKARSDWSFQKALYVSETNGTFYNDQSLLALKDWSILKKNKKAWLRMSNELPQIIRFVFKSLLLSFMGCHNVHPY